MFVLVLTEIFAILQSYLFDFVNLCISNNKILINKVLGRVLRSRRRRVIKPIYILKLLRFKTNFENPKGRLYM